LQRIINFDWSGFTFNPLLPTAAQAKDLEKSAPTPDVLIIAKTKTAPLVGFSNTVSNWILFALREKALRFLV
jgi:hypothetical protein